MIQFLSYLAASSQEVVEGGQVHLVGEDLDDALHQILLGDWVAAGHHLLQDSRQNNPLVPGKKPLREIK